MPNNKFAALMAATALLLSLTACGSDEPESTATDDPAGSGGAFPATVTTALGEVEIPEEPQRVVTLDFPSTDAALALGIVPVGIAKVSYVDGDIQEWTEAALDGAEPEMFDVEVETPVEQIAALDPDLILGAGSYNAGAGVRQALADRAGRGLGDRPRQRLLAAADPQRREGARPGSRR